MLLKALVEAEIDGVTVSNHLTALKDTIDSLSKVKLPLSRLYRMEDLRWSTVIIIDLMDDIFLEQEAHESARSFNEAAAGVVIRKD